MDITLYEKVNREKLSQVLNCINYPFDTYDKENKKNIQLKQLINYSKKKLKDGKVAINYTQKNKYGRFYTSYGLQTFKKDIRKYISGEYYLDLDFVNCHPVILNHLLKQNNANLSSTSSVKSDGKSLLEIYVNDRDTYLNKYKLSKEDVIKFINSETCNKEFFKEIHNQIYKDLVPVLISENKVLFNRIKKERIKNKKDYNHSGSFLAQYLQNIENDMLMILYKYLNQKGYIVGTLCFDGLLVEKTDSIESLEKDLINVEDIILKETGINIKIVFKSMETEWKPERPEKIIMEKELNEKVVNYSINTNKNLFENCFASDEEGRIIYSKVNYSEIPYLINYLNNFVCKVNYPHAYGWRFNINEKFELRSKSKVDDRIKFGFEFSRNPDVSWCHIDDALLYDKFVFDVNDKNVNINDYNLYKRPKYTDTGKSLKEIAPILNDFIMRIISNNDERVYNFLINWTSKMSQVGMTCQLIVLMGKMGTGKSTFTDILSYIIGIVYYVKVDNIKDIVKNFNSIYEKAILTIVEEVVSDAGEYHSIQSKLKKLTTDSDIIIEKKGIDSYMSKSMNNFILITNECNPIKITEDNRRNMIIKVPDTLIGDYQYFIDLRREVKENLEAIRGFFNTYKYEDNLNSIRPITEAEKELLILNESPAQTFIKSLRLTKDSPRRVYKTLYDTYIEYCRQYHYKQISAKYFTVELNKQGYETVRKTVNRLTKTYITGNEVDIDIETDEDDE